MDTARAEARIRAWQNKRVAVVGDLMLDRYVWGAASRISQEAPIPVVEVKRTTARPGGAANVLHNIVALGARALAFGVVGEDAIGSELSGLLSGLGVDTSGLLHDRARLTTEKTRIIAGNQQIVRVDTERKDPLSVASVEALLARLEAAFAADGIAALIIEDYAKGVLNPSLTRAIIEIAARHGVPVALDPHPANHLDAAGLTLMTPNRAEAFALAGRYLTDPVQPVAEDMALREVAARIQETWEVRHLLITLGADGMALFQEGEPALHVPTLAREVFDVSGAGDTVIASFVLALTAGASPEEAAVISNHAAGVVVGKVGTAPVQRAELLDYFRAEHHE